MDNANFDKSKSCHYCIYNTLEGDYIYDCEQYQEIFTNNARNVTCNKFKKRKLFATIIWKTKCILVPIIWNVKDFLKIR